MAGRKGFLLLEALAALLLISSLGAAVFPLAGQAARALMAGSMRGEMGEAALFVMDLMTEKVRNNLDPMPAKEIKRDRYAFHEWRYIYDEKKKEYTKIKGKYVFYKDGEKLKINIHGDNIQPITGEKSKGEEDIAFESREGEPVFRQEKSGPVHMVFRLRHRMGKIEEDYETSVIPYADFYRKGKPYE